MQTVPHAGSAALGRYPRYCDTRTADLRRSALPRCRQVSEQPLREPPYRFVASDYSLARLFRPVSCSFFISSERSLGRSIVSVSLMSLLLLS